MHALVLLALAASPDVNLLTLEAGAVAVEASDSYGGDWTVDGLVDGNPRTGWCSPMGARGPWTFVFELEQRSAQLPANLLQAQRDFFGAHTYERIDRPEGQFFHTAWPEVIG